MDKNKVSTQRTPYYTKKKAILSLQSKETKLTAIQNPLQALF